MIKVQAFILLLFSAPLQASFHEAPELVHSLKNPFRTRSPKVLKEGSLLFAKNCASCHGVEGEGAGNVPALRQGPVQSAADSEIYWFIEKGSPENGMPAISLSEIDRWKLVTYLKSLPSSPRSTIKSQNSVPTQPSPNDLPAPILAPRSPFTDYRYEKPGLFHHIQVKDLPEPAPETSVGNGPEIVSRPKDAWPQVPAGFQVQLFASELDNPRYLRTAPNGDIFLAESSSGKIRVFRGLTKEGKAEKTEVFLNGLNRPYGILFYPPGPNPRWIYVGDTDAVLRFPYQSGDLHSTGTAQKLMDLPNASNGHWTRDIELSLDGKKLFIAVGSASNVDDPDLHPTEKSRADILVVNSVDGSQRHVYASGLRNAGGGMAVDPATGELWASVNERDGLGDNLVPDYITKVKEGGFYGWPWWYMGGHQDPRHSGKHPELKDKVITPDVLLQPHHASLQMLFYEGKQFPAEYKGDIFATQHGSWNRSVRTGYELIRIPLHPKTPQEKGSYEDFMTGFVIDNTHVWGRPVGVAQLADGSLLVSDDGSNSLWRIFYSRP